MKKFNDLVFENHPNGMGGFQARMDFPNGFGVSVVCGQFFYCSPKKNLPDASMYHTYEVAIVEGGSLTYDTPITDDVLGYLTPTEVTDVMGQVQSLVENI